MSFRSEARNLNDRQRYKISPAGRYDKVSLRHYTNYFSFLINLHL